MTATMEKPAETQMEEALAKPKSSKKAAASTEAIAPLPELRASVGAKPLLRAVQSVLRAVPTRTSLPILGHVLLEATGLDDVGGPRLVLTASDLEVWIGVSVPARVESAGWATVPARWLTETVSRLPDGDVSLRCEAQATHLAAGRGKFKSLGLAPDDFPLMPTTPAPAAFLVEPDDFCLALRRTLYAASADESRPALTGILLAFYAGRIRLVATDGSRMGYSECAYTDGPEDAGGWDGEERRVILPADTARVLLALADGAERLTLELCVPEQSGNVSQVRFTAPRADGSETVLLSRVIAEQFPNWERIVPMPHDQRVSIPLGPLRDALRRALPIAKEDALRVVLRGGDGGMTLSSASTTGDTGEWLEADWLADTEAFGMNAAFLGDALDATEGDSVCFEVTQPLRAVVIRGDVGDPSFALVMPMQIVE